jgi:hypothetical protein
VEVRPALTSADGRFRFRHPADEARDLVVALNPDAEGAAYVLSCLNRSIGLSHATDERNSND